MAQAPLATGAPALRQQGRAATVAEHAWLATGVAARQTPQKAMGQKQSGPRLASTAQHRSTEMASDHGVLGVTAACGCSGKQLFRTALRRSRGSICSRSENEKKSEELAKANGQPRSSDRGRESDLWLRRNEAGGGPSGTELTGDASPTTAKTPEGETTGGSTRGRDSGTGGLCTTQSGASIQSRHPSKARMATHLVAREGKAHPSRCLASNYHDSSVRTHE